MKEVLRWIFYIPVVIIAQMLSMVALEFLLRILFKIGYFVFFWGSRYYMPPMTSLGATIEDVKTFIFTTCLALVGSGIAAGLVGQWIIPEKGRTAAFIILCIVLLLWFAMNCIILWRDMSPVWWIGLIGTIAYIIAYILLIALAYDK